MEGLIREGEDYVRAGGDKDVRDCVGHVRFLRIEPLQDINRRLASVFAFARQSRRAPRGISTAKSLRIGSARYTRATFS